MVIGGHHLQDAAAGLARRLAAQCLAIRDLRARVTLGSGGHARDRSAPSIVPEVAAHSALSPHDRAQTVAAAHPAPAGHTGGADGGFTQRDVVCIAYPDHLQSRDRTPLRTLYGLGGWDAGWLCQ